MIDNKIKPKILKVINKFPTSVTILRDSTNEFGEPDLAHEICKVTGFWHDGSSVISQITNDAGTIKREKQSYLMLTYNENSCLIKEGDYFKLDNEKFEIVDKGNKNKMNIYFDMLVKRC